MLQKTFFRQLKIRRLRSADFLFFSFQNDLIQVLFQTESVSLQIVQDIFLFEHFKNLPDDLSGEL